MTGSVSLHPPVAQNAVADQFSESLPVAGVQNSGAIVPRGDEAAFHQSRWHIAGTQHFEPGEFHPPVGSAQSGGDQSLYLSRQFLSLRIVIKSLSACGATVGAKQLHDIVASHLALGTVRHRWRRWSRRAMTLQRP